MTNPADQTSQAQEPAQQPQGQEPTPAPTPNDLAQQQAEQQQEPEQQPVDNAAAESVDQLPDWAQKEIRKAREQAAKARVNAKTAAEEAENKAKAERDTLVQELGKKLGLIEDTSNDPEQLLTAAQQQAQQYQQERDTMAEQLNNYRRKDAVTSALSKVDGNVDTVLLDSILQLDNAYKELDINADDFGDQVSAIITQKLENHPSLVQATHKASGVDTSNTQRGTSKPLTRADLANMTADEINQAVKDGKLAHLMNQNN